jgi:hypothetical protein
VDATGSAALLPVTPEDEIGNTTESVQSLSLEIQNGVDFGTTLVHRDRVLLGPSFRTMSDIPIEPKNCRSSALEAQVSTSALAYGIWLS